MLMKLAVFDALSKIARSDLDSAASRSAKMVLVYGVSQAEAVRETGATRSTVSDAVRRVQKYDEMIRKAYGLSADFATSAEPPPGGYPSEPRREPKRRAHEEDHFAEEPEEEASDFDDDAEDADDPVDWLPAQPARPRKIGRRF